ncbi:hypothetical protein B0H13DRAFT_1901883 [Mycena leptocephala]|nr:hypothetical protein B0H13DRAFT_1901883 [Mycena leptocephala]
MSASQWKIRAFTSATSNAAPGPGCKPTSGAVGYIGSYRWQPPLIEVEGVKTQQPPADQYGVFNIFYRGMAVASDVLPFLMFILNFPGVHSIQGATTTIWWLPLQRLPFSDVRGVFEEQPGSHHHRLPFPGMLSVLPPSALPIKKVKIIERTVSFELDLQIYIWHTDRYAYDCSATTMSILQTGSIHPAPAQRHAELLNRDNPMVAATRCPGSRTQNGFNVGNREFLDAPAESRGRSTAPTQRHAALLKSADPMVAATRCPDCAKREELEGHTQSCDYRFGPEVAAVKDGNVAGAYTSGTGHGISKSAPRSAGTVKGATKAEALFVPADPDAHGPSLGWLPDVFRVASLGSIGTVAPKRCKHLSVLRFRPSLRARLLRTG